LLPQSLTRHNYFMFQSLEIQGTPTSSVPASQAFGDLLRTSLDCQFRGEYEAASQDEERAQVAAGFCSYSPWALRSPWLITFLEDLRSRSTDEARRMLWRILEAYVPERRRKKDADTIEAIWSDLNIIEALCKSIASGLSYEAAVGEVVDKIFKPNCKVSNVEDKERRVRDVFERVLCPALDRFLSLVDADPSPLSDAARTHLDQVGVSGPGTRARLEAELAADPKFKNAVVRIQRGHIKVVRNRVQVLRCGDVVASFVEWLCARAEQVETLVDA
jgi:hypothetical protein